MLFDQRMVGEPFPYWETISYLQILPQKIFKLKKKSYPIPIIFKAFIITWV
jgi:hypothetical protein